MSTLSQFTINLDRDVQYVGQDLSRPECVLPMLDGSLYVSDNRHALTHIRPDGTQTTLGESGETNGFTMDSRGNLLVADWGAKRVLRIRPDGHTETVLEAVDGEPLGPVNYVWVDSRDRLWVAISTRREIWFDACAHPAPDGYIVLVDENGARIVADGFMLTNEIKLNPDETYLYVAETMGARLFRFPVRADGSLGEREAVGPESLGPTHFVDGFSFDEQSNVWVTTVLRNGLVVIDGQTGDVHTVFEDPIEAGLQAFANAQQTDTVAPMHLGGCASPRIALPTSVNFGGPDRKTVYIGSLGMPCLMTFQSPVAGAKMLHWR